MAGQQTGHRQAAAWLLANRSTAPLAPTWPCSTNCSPMAWCRPPRRARRSGAHASRTATGQQTFTLLRLQPNLIWEPQARPAASAGQVVIGSVAVSPPTPSTPHAPEPESASNPAPRAEENGVQVSRRFGLQRWSTLGRQRRISSADGLSEHVRRIRRERMQLVVELFK